MALHAALTGPIAVALSLGAATAISSPAVADTAKSGEELYLQHCAACHEHPQTGVPPRREIAGRGAPFIIEKLTFGSMQAQALTLSDEDIAALARYLEANPSGQAENPPPVDPAPHTETYRALVTRLTP